MGTANVGFPAAATEVPAGFIGLWSGAVNAVPKGWALCNGQNGTPDLRDRFVVGAGNSYAVGAKGGEAVHTLTVAEMPSHSHSVSVAKVSGGGYGKAVKDEWQVVSTAWEAWCDTTGGNQPHNSLPPYYALCYIMKL